MGPRVTAIVAIGLVCLALIVLGAQPARSWRDAAEHSRVFWLWWMVGSAAVGLLPLVDGLGWAGTTWLALWCAFAALQPAFVADVLEVRRHLNRMRVRGRRLRAEARQRFASGEGLP